ncbi:MAG: hypothetical protein AAGI70_12835 [Pseudomonadota bacterium]
MSETAEPTILETPAAANLAAAEAVVEVARTAAEGAVIEVKAAEVETVSTTYILALLSAAAGAAAGKWRFVLASPSPALIDAFSDLGLFQDLAKMEIRP